MRPFSEPVLRPSKRLFGLSRFMAWTTISCPLISNSLWTNLPTKHPTGRARARAFAALRSSSFRHFFSANARTDTPMLWRLFCTELYSQHNALRENSSRKKNHRRDGEDPLCVAASSFSKPKRIIRPYEYARYYGDFCVKSFELYKDELVLTGIPHAWSIDHFYFCYGRKIFTNSSLYIY